MQNGTERCDINYQELPIELKRKVDYLAISVVEIKIFDHNKKDEILHKIFANLNNGGKQLSNQELRNGIYPCSFNRAINRINKHNKKWRVLWGGISDEGEDVEMLYRLAALKRYVTFSCKIGYRIEGYRNSTKDMIDRFAEESFSLNEKEIIEYTDSISSFISRLDISRKYFSKKTLLEGYLWRVIKI